MRSPARLHRSRYSLSARFATGTNGLGHARAARGPDLRCRRCPRRQTRTHVRARRFTRARARPRARAARAALARTPPPTIAGARAVPLRSSAVRVARRPRAHGRRGFGTSASAASIACGGTRGGSLRERALRAFRSRTVTGEGAVSPRARTSAAASQLVPFPLSLSPPPWGDEYPAHSGANLTRCRMEDPGTEERSRRCWAGWRSSPSALSPEEEIRRRSASGLLIGKVRRRRERAAPRRNGSKGGQKALPLARSRRVRARPTARSLERCPRRCPLSPFLKSNRCPNPRAVNHGTRHR